MKKNFYISIGIAICFMLMVISPLIVSANNVDYIIQQMEESYRRQMRGIDDMTIVQGMDAGFFNIESITYQKKALVNNQEIFKFRTETNAMGMNMVTIFDGIYTWSVDPVSGEIEQEKGGMDPLQVWKIFDPDKMRYLGEEKLNDKDVYVVQLDDAIWMMGQEEIASQGMSEDAEEVEMQSIYWIDKSQFIPLKSRNIMKAISIEDEEPVSVNTISDVQFLDYRLIGTILIPHQIIISTQMDIDDPTLTDEERKMAQSMMSSMGNMEMKVKRVEINKGLPNEFFDGSLLESQKPMFGDIPEISQDESTQPNIDSMPEEDIGPMIEDFMNIMKDFLPKEE